MAAMTAVDIVPHTHWDREWYAPFQHFRARLVELLDDLLPRLEADPAFTHFLLDGQMAVVDDYLAIRPEARARLERLAAAGRLAAGPWYTLPDEFLVSGETHIRNLQLGLAKADAMGGAMRVGYLPDMFGHIAQMPQLFRLFGFEHAVVWRGVPAAITSTGFWWEAPDGSRVRAEYLPTGYGNGAAMPADPQRFVDRIASWIDEHRATIGEADVLWMNGSDHRTPQAFLPSSVAAANALTDRFELRITSLTEHLRNASTDGLATWQGEMRSGARTNVLMGVTSNRIDVRVAVARAERALEQIAEPLATALLPEDQYPHALLAEAWLAMCRNAAHDSVCACSADEVVDAVLHRYAEARQIGEAIEERSLRHLADHLAHHGPVAVNPSTRGRDGLVTVRFPGTDPWPGTQVVDTQPGEVERCSLPIEQALAVVPEIAGWTDDVDGITVREEAGFVNVVLHCDGTTGPLPADRSTVAADLARRAASGATWVRLVVRRPPTFDALVAVCDVPALGWTPATPSEPRDLRPPLIVIVHEDTHTMSNGLITVTVDSQGTFGIDDNRGLGVLVDEGDRGDTYNWCPTSYKYRTRRPAGAMVRTLERGPLRAVIEIRRAYFFRNGIDGETGAKSLQKQVPIATLLELRAGERFLRVTYDFVNTVEDHRLRAWFPVGGPPVGTSRAECAFTTVERGLTAEGGPTETPLPTFPSRRFVSAGQLTIAHEGINEYELVEVGDSGARAIALTLLRATRWLSNGPMATRPLPAGPIVELRGSQCLGRHTLKLAVAVGDIDPYQLVEDAFVPLLVANGAAHGDLPPRHEGLAVEGAVTSAVHRTPTGEREIRCFDQGSGGTVRITDGGAPVLGHVVDLNGDEIGPFEGSKQLRPHEIVTIVHRG